MSVRTSRVFRVMAIGLLSISTAVYAASLMEEKLNLERSIQERSEHLVEKIIGSQNMVVLVNVELESSDVSPKKKGEFLGTTLSEEEYLPGITYSNIPVALGNKATTIKRINVLVTVDVGVSMEITNQMKKELFEVLGLDAVRGDTVSVKKIRFAQAAKAGWKEYAERFSIQIFLALALFIVTIFLFGPLRGFFKNMASTKVNIDAALKAGDLGGALGGGGGINAPKLTLALEKEGEKLSKHFTFVNELNLQNLVFLLKGESKEKVAMAINFLPATYASQVFSSLDRDTQCYVTESLAEKRLLQQTEVFNIEEEVKQRIDYLTGGVEHVLNILEHLNVRLQENMLETLAQERPAVAKQLRLAMFFFQDIMLLDKPSILKLIRTAQNKGMSFPVALARTDKQLKDKVVTALPEGAQLILTEQMRLVGDVSEARVLEEQRTIARLARLMEKSGEITVNRKEMEGIIANSDGQEPRKNDTAKAGDNQAAAGADPGATWLKRLSENRRIDKDTKNS